MRQTGNDVGWESQRDSHAGLPANDRLFELGFASQLAEILKRMPDLRQTLLFSATMPQLLADFARAGLSNPETIRLDVEMQLSPLLSMAFFTVRSEEKVAALLFLVEEIINLRKEQVIIFAATRHHVEYLISVLEKNGLEVASLFGALDAEARNRNMSSFRSKRSSVLIVTDVAARGVDIPLLDNVINFDFPARPNCSCIALVV